MDSIAKAQKEVAIQEIQAKFQTELQREKNLVLEENNMTLQKQMQTEKVLMLLYIFISIALIVLILLFLRGYWLKNRLQKEELKSIETEKNIIQQQHLHEQELTNSQKEIIEEKQRELTSTALRMANYQDNISDIIEKCNNNTGLNVNDVKKELQLLMKQKDYWKQFETRFNTLHPEFGNILTGKFPKLTKNDIEFCSLLKLNLSNKEIASLLQISHESAITKKYRIKKKMEIQDDEEFEKLIMEI
jgi:DNA-binding CsgD family transcriptional regulator